MRSELPSICIIGAGAVGLTLANALARRNVRVTLIEGGGARPAGELEDTYRTLVTGTPHRGVHEGRFRAWGGSTTRWGGQLWPWERDEFEARPYLSLKAWPISFDDIAPYYDDALDILRVPTSTLLPEAAAERGVKLPDLDDAAFGLKFSTWLPWRLRNFGRSLGPALRKNPNVTVHMGKTVVGLAMDDSGRSATGVRVRAQDGTETVIHSDMVVAAAGTIETARLLLASAQRAGTPNNYWLGRGFMDHLSVRVARFTPNDPKEFARMFSPVFARDIQYTPRMVLRPALRERERLLAAYGHWDTELPADSGLLVVRDKLRAIQAGRTPQLSRSDLRGIAGGARELATMARGLAFDRRRYFPKDASVYLRVDTEQLPDPESRVTLASECDPTGLPRVEVDWRVSDLERHTVMRTAELLGEELERRGIGRVEHGPDPFGDDVPWGPLKGDSFHMMGGTRMSRTPECGVVDTNSRVFGLDNVYVASASVFPTGGMANPTLTALALALRLADHIAPAAERVV